MVFGIGFALYAFGNYLVIIEDIFIAKLVELIKLFINLDKYELFPSSRLPFWVTVLAWIDESVKFAEILAE